MHGVSLDECDGFVFLHEVKNHFASGLVFLGFIWSVFTKCSRDIEGVDNEGFCVEGLIAGLWLLQFAEDPEAQGRQEHLGQGYAKRFCFGNLACSVIPLHSKVS